MTKTCFKCSKILPLDSFYKHPSMPDGRVNKCKECTKHDVRENRKDKIEYYREYDKSRANNPSRVNARSEYAKTPNGKLAHKKAKAAWKQKNAIKLYASTLINNYVRDGKIIKPESCSNCGCSSKRIHGHHDDYAHPTVVRWLCPKCHTLWHKENGEGDNCSV